MSAELERQLRIERVVRENLAARLGALTAENIELLARLYEIEHPEPASDPQPPEEAQP